MSNDSKESPIRRQETLTKKTVSNLLEIQNLKTATEGNQFQMTMAPLSPKQLGDPPLSPTQISPCLGDKTEMDRENV